MPATLVQRARAAADDVPVSDVPDGDVPVDTPPRQTVPVDTVPVDTVPVDDGERGDVPGWVLVTLMTAGLVLALWAVAGPALSGVFETAIERVTSFG